MSATPTAAISSCVVCRQAVSGDCRCRICDSPLHCFCAVEEGLEGHGAIYLCVADCEQGRVNEVPPHTPTNEVTDNSTNFTATPEMLFSPDNDSPQDFARLLLADHPLKKTAKSDLQYVAEAAYCFVQRLCSIPYCYDKDHRKLTSCFCLTTIGIESLPIVSNMLGKFYWQHIFSPFPPFSCFVTNNNFIVQFRLLSNQKIFARQC